MHLTGTHPHEDASPPWVGDLAGPVIAAVGDDEQAAGVAVTARRLGGAPPVAVHVRPLPPVAGAVPVAGAPFAGHAMRLDDHERTRAALHDEGRAVLDRLDLGDAELVAAVGDPVAELCRVARERGASAIVTGSRRRGGVRSALLGSVSRELARDAPCPVVVAEAEVRDHGGPVLAGLPDDAADAAQVEDHARRLARALERPLLMLHAEDSEGPGDEDDGRTLEPAGAGAWRLDAHGRPADVLRDAAGHVDAALVVVGSRTGALGGIVGASTSLELTRTLLHPVALVPLRALDDADAEAHGRPGPG